jgi:hypothetical protein
MISWETVERHAVTVDEDTLASMAGITAATVRALPVPIRTSLALVSADGIVDALASRENDDTYQATLDRSVVHIVRADV